MNDIGILAIVPSILVVIVAIKLKRPVAALSLGCISSYAIIAYFTGTNFPTLALNSFFKVLTDRDNIKLILICGIFGSLITLLNASHGTDAIASCIHKFCKKTTSVLLSAWVLGVSIFVDDYMNVMTVSSCFRKLCDKLHISRAELAYVIHSSGAPACVLVPFSTWAIFFAENFYEQEAVRELHLGNSLGTYCHIIPYIFYAILSIILVPLFILRILPVFPAMKKEQMKLESADVIREESESVTGTGRLIDFLLPIITMIGMTIISGDMFYSLLCAIFICAVLYLFGKIMTVARFMDLFVKGFSDMVPTLLVLLFAFYMKQACNDIRLPEYIVSLFMPYVSAAFFPAIAFVMVSILSFVTGDSWGIPSVCIAIIIPVAVACNANLIYTMASVVSGAVFCSHACFYSDATILTASSCGIEPYIHAKTQIPYAMIAFLVSFCGYLLLGILG